MALSIFLSTLEGYHVEIRHRRVITFDEALAMQDDEKKEGNAVSHDHRVCDRVESEGFYYSPKIPGIPDKASKVAKTEGNKRNQEVALFSAEEGRVVTHYYPMVRSWTAR